MNEKDAMPTSPMRGGDCHFSTTRNQWKKFLWWPLSMELTVLCFAIMDLGISAAEYERCGGSRSLYKNCSEGSAVEWLFFAAPSITVVWTIIDLFLFRFGLLHPVYAVTVATIGFCGWVIQTWAADFFNLPEDWTLDRGLRWGILISGIMATIAYFVYMVIAASEVHYWRKRRSVPSSWTAKSANRRIYRAVLVAVDVFLLCMVTAELGTAVASSYMGTSSYTGDDGFYSYYTGTDAYMVTVPIASFLLTLVDLILWLVRTMSLGWTAGIYLLLLVGWAAQSGFVMDSEGNHEGYEDPISSAHIGMTFATMVAYLLGALFCGSAAVLDRTPNTHGTNPQGAAEPRDEPSAELQSQKP